MKWFLVFGSFIIIVFSQTGMAFASCSGIPGCNPRLDSLSSCDMAEMNLENFISKLSNSCAVDTDCGALYIRANGCKPPAVLPKSSLHSGNEPELKALQDSVREACRQEYSKLPACEPIPAYPKCKQEKCIDSR